MEISALDPADLRVVRASVAGPAARLIAERVDTPNRLNDKDAHDAYRILRAVGTEPLCATFALLLRGELSGQVTRDALRYLEDLFASGPDALGAKMAGRAEEGVGDPDQVAVAVSTLARGLLQSLAAD